MKKILLLTAMILCFLNLINAQDGKLDPAFGTNGIVKTFLGKNYNYNVLPVRQILPQTDGSMYVL